MPYFSNLFKLNARGKRQEPKNKEPDPFGSPARKPLDSGSRLEFLAQADIPHPLANVVQIASVEVREGGIGLGRRFVVYIGHAHGELRRAEMMERVGGLQINGPIIADEASRGAVMIVADVSGS